MRRSVEEHTDRLAVGPWQTFGRSAPERLADLLGDYRVAVVPSGLLPSESTLGMGKG